MSKIKLEEEFKKLFRDYQKTVFEATEVALDKGSLALQNKLSAASPVGEGPLHFKDSWDRKMQYKGVKFVGNTKTVHRPDYVRKGTGEKVQHEGGIPLSSLLEYSRNGHPFIQRTFNQNKNEIFQIIIKELGGNI